MICFREVKTSYVKQDILCIYMIHIMHIYSRNNIMLSILKNIDFLMIIFTGFHILLYELIKNEIIELKLI